ncbi:MAG: carboxyl-terminal processing protease [Rhodothermaceae bacterium]|nr:MAG: carboxyl-terminal processing protease [Rhodothermaceae bacterium]
MKSKTFFGRVHVRLLAGLFVALALGFAVGFWVPRDDDFFALRKNYQIFGALYEELVAGYVDRLDPEKLMRRGIDAMLRDLDPYTVFYDQADHADIDIMMRGRYGGVGLNAAFFDGKLTVTAPVEGTSSYRQGVRAGDVITHIAGQPTEGLTLDDVQNLLRGEPGTTVEITVERAGEPAPLHFLLMREQVRLKNLSFHGFVDDDTAAGIGYIKLDRFAEGAAADVRQALQDLQRTGRLRGLILDLRDNPGGLLEAAVEIAGLFVPRHTALVSTRGRQPESERVYRTPQAPLAPELPLAVLVNGLSASASEIVAGALQDLDRAVIVGERSFGKGLVQIVRPLPYNTSLKLTTARYYIPSGRSIQALDYGRHDGTATTTPDSLRHAFTTAGGRTVFDGRGVEPDVEAAPEAPGALEQALDRRAAFLFFASHFAATHPLPEGDGSAGDRFARTFGVAPADFEVSDTVLDAFRSWLDTQHFTYQTPAEHTLATLTERLEESGYMAETGDEVAALRAEIERQKAADFERHRARLKERLRTELLARYLSEEARIRASMTHDQTVRAAFRLLQDSAAYAAILHPR